ncbi:active regulator of SIRT1 isoform X2 [Heliangelus exortis]|uniref:active regulator of SIRT1 isoform X2 n=1 Tax=Heliangelus exortis TaxID=472823 RepID=UPI003A922AC1
MSASLLRRGLELLEAPGQGKALPGLQRGPEGLKAVGAARRRRAAAESGRNKATVKGRVVKSAIEEYHKKKPVNHLKKNLKYMLKGRIVANKAITEQLPGSSFSIRICKVSWYLLLSQGPALTSVIVSPLPLEAFQGTAGC